MLRGLADKSDFKIMNGHRPVSGHVVDESPFHKIDDQGTAPFLDHGCAHLQERLATVFAGGDHAFGHFGDVVHFSGQVFSG